MIEKSKEESYLMTWKLFDIDISVLVKLCFVFCFFKPCLPIHWPVVCSCFHLQQQTWMVVVKSAGQQNRKYLLSGPLQKGWLTPRIVHDMGERQGKPTAECFLKNKGGVKISDWCANYCGDPKKWMPSARPRVSIGLSFGYFWPLN